jgi:hypothetical protein
MSGQISTVAPHAKQETPHPTSFVGHPLPTGEGWDFEFLFDFSSAFAGAG